MNNLVLKISEFIHINDKFSSVWQLEHVILKCPTISVLPLNFLKILRNLHFLKILRNLNVLKILKNQNFKKIHEIKILN